jgi:hypothetical protein
VPVAGSPGSKNAPDTSSTVVTRMTKVNVRSATYPVSVHEATTGKELGAIELLGRSFRMRVSVVPRHRGESQLENLARALRSTKRDRNKKRRRPESGDGCRVPLEVAVRMAPEVGVARSVGGVTGLRVSSKVAVCWEHRRARPRRRAPQGGFLRRADGIIDRPEDYLHATDAATRNPRARLARLSEQRRDDFVDGAGGMSR